MDEGGRGGGIMARKYGSQWPGASWSAAMQAENNRPCCLLQ